MKRMASVAWLVAVLVPLSYASGSTIPTVSEAQSAVNQTMLTTCANPPEKEPCPEAVGVQTAPTAPPPTTEPVTGKKEPICKNSANTVNAPGKQPEAQPSPGLTAGGTATSGNGCDIVPGSVTPGLSAVHTARLSYMHEALDYGLGMAGGSCVACGGVGGRMPGALPRLEVRRVVKFRGNSQRSSLAPGAYIGYDVTLDLNANARRIYVWDPRVEYQHTMLDPDSDGVFLDNELRDIQEIRLYSNSVPTAAMLTATHAVLKTWDQSTYGFEVIRLADSVYNVNRRGRLIYVRDRDGKGVEIAYQYAAGATDQELGYDRSNLWKMESASDPYGARMDFTYKTNKVMSCWVLDHLDLPDGKTLTYEYDLTNGLSRVNHPDGTVTKIDWSLDAGSQTKKISFDDPAAEGTHRRKDVYISLSTWKDPDTGQTYSQADRRVRWVVNGAGEVGYWNKTASESNNVTAVYVYEGGGRYLRYRYAGNCAPISVEYATQWSSLNQDPATMQWQLQFTYTTDQYSRVTGETDLVCGTNRTATYQRDVQSGAITNAIFPDGTSEQTTFSALNFPTRRADAMGRLTEWTYDTVGNPLSRTEGAGTTNAATWSWTYNANGQVTKEYGPNYHATDHPFFQNEAACTEYSYSTTGLLMWVKQAADDPVNAPEERGVTSNAYDSVGRLISVTDPVGRVKEYSYDDRNRVKTVTYHSYPDYSTEEVTYYTNESSGAWANLVKEFKDRNGNFTQYFYDGMGRKVCEKRGIKGPGSSNPEAIVWEGWKYLPGTTLVAERRSGAKELDPDHPESWTGGRVTRFEYDAKRRVTAVTAWVDNQVALTGSTVYDESKRVAWTEDEYGRRRYPVYDSRTREVRVVTELVPGGAGTVPTNDFQRVMYLLDLARVANDPPYVVEETEYNANGEITARIDGKGSRTTFAYNELGRLVERVEAAGTAVEAKTQFAYDPAGNPIRVVHPRSFTESPTNFVTEFTYSGRNLVLSTVEGAGTSVAATNAVSYYLDGCIKDATDAEGKVRATKWRTCCAIRVGAVEPAAYVDDSEDLKKATRISGTDYANQPTYSAVVKDIPANPTQDWWRNPPETDTVNEVTARLDARGRPVAQTVWLAPLTVGNAWTNPPIAGEDGIPATNGLTTRWIYDEDLTDGVGLDAVYSSQLALLEPGFFGTNCSGASVAEVNPNGETNAWFTDGAGRPVLTVDGLGHATLGIYDIETNGLVETCVVDALGHTVCRRADARGSVREVVDAEGYVTTNRFDANGNLISVRDPNGVGFDSVFDERNREIERWDTLASGDGGPVRAFQATYDAHGNVVSAVDALTKETTAFYDQRDRRMSVTDRLGGTTAFGYNRNGVLTSVVDAEQRETTWSFDARSLPVVKQYADHQDGTEPGQPGYDRVTARLDAAGRLLWREDQRGVKTTPTYDMANRMLERGYSSIAEMDRFGYDGASRLVWAESDRFGNLRTFAYDRAGRVVTNSLSIEGIAYPVSYSYDAADRQTGMVYPDGRVLERAFTARDQLGELTFHGNTLATIARDAGGRETSRTLGNGLLASRTYRGDDLLRTIQVPQILNYSYGYDANKRITGETDGIRSALTQSMDYDDEDRVTTWQRNNTVPGLKRTQTWTLTLEGDWSQTVSDGASENRTHNSVHELRAVAGQSLAYDLRGNLITNSVRGQEYLWDEDDQLVKVETNAVEIASYAYDAFGTRVRKAVGTNVTTYVVAGDRVVAEYQGTNLVRAYVYGEHVDEPVAVVMAGATNYYHRSDNGSISCLTDSSGALVEYYAYNAYGERAAFDVQGNAIVASQPYGFTGREHDPETGLVYYRARYFDPALGRFVNRDPIGEWGGLNLFEYCESDPWGLLDPFGFASEKTFLGQTFGSKEYWKKTPGIYTAFWMGAGQMIKQTVVGIVEVELLVEKMEQAGVPIPSILFPGLQSQSTTPLQVIEALNKIVGCDMIEVMKQGLEKWSKSTEEKIFGLLPTISPQEKIYGKTIGYWTTFAASFLVGGQGAAASSETKLTGIVGKIGPAFQKLATKWKWLGNLQNLWSEAAKGGTVYRVMSQEELAGAKLGKYADSPYMNPSQAGKKWVWATKEQAVQWKALLEKGGEKPIITEIPTKSPLSQYEAFPHETPPGPAYLVPIEELGPASHVR